MKSSRRVLGIIASPRNSGNTAVLVKEVLKGAQEKGYETELKCLGDLEINPLVECASDKSWGVTGPTDDMELIYSSLEKTNVLVFGTPIYFDHVSDRAKIFVDRLIYYLKPGAKERLSANIRAVIIITYADGRPELYDNVIEWIKGELESIFKGLKVVATLKAENTMRNPVANREDLLKKAHQIGINLEGNDILRSPRGRELHE